jgi:hypothetical protein
MPVYRFDWEPAKAHANRQKHGVSFAEAAMVFLDPRAVSVYDAEHSRLEDRWVTLCISSVGRLLVVCHTFEEIGRHRGRVRIISARKPTAKEAQQYGQ